ncbi:CD9 antigen-like protein [Dinothrombium tinctorium]|uniref:CD9 antigen-like protein n=1 Tax=Dinothrombium tinctorium TaxID=1965070 RepID=A0A3S3RU80_9ACAR|nr:CD9 antigen-like protein [Dinothrombium tinctorium]RWS00887.1 CD9 antigen-like protein [Dinothrombium tinctorium]RWS01031.1 CD9 antigen-like protein [Dinothrombium tinctorium]RWS06107.1 CD9 antigen-like protein [Dinothrombium tinctorium]
MINRTARVLYVLNFYIWAGGVLMLSLGVWIISDNVFIYVNEFLDIEIDCFVIIAISMSLGVCLMFTSIVSCYAIRDEHRYLLILLNKITRQWLEIINSRESDPQIKHFTDVINAKLNCCGAQSWQDYLNTSIPESCKFGNQVYLMGCGETLFQYFDLRLSLICGVSNFLTLLQFIATLITSKLYETKSKKISKTIDRDEANISNKKNM